MPYRKIYVPVDGSDLSNAAMQMATLIAGCDGAQVVGSHVYAARLHDQRFRAMESGLPEQYQEEQELEKQRTIHDSLITRGLELISDSYLEPFEEICAQNSIPFSGVSLEGRNWQELVKDIESQDHDLIALGGHGVGRVGASQLGTVTERILRRVHRDILICKQKADEVSSDCIVVCLDGSSRSWGALRRGIGLAKSFDKRLLAVSAFDPYFHYAMFSTISGVLSDQAREVFKFEEQEKLHETIIDSGLAKIYQSHLELAARIGRDEDLEIETRLLDGKAYAEVLEFVRSNPPWLLILGRVGIHSDDRMDIGGNTENICRLADCNILVVDLKSSVPLEYQAQETVTWTREAQARMTMVPAMARGVAMKAVQNHAIAEGHTVITSSVLSAAIKGLLPPEAIARMGIDFDDEEPDGAQSPQQVSDVKPDQRFRCPACGYVHTGAQPQQCPVCGNEGANLKPVAEGVVEDGVIQGGMGERKLIWQKEAIEVLNGVENEILRQQIRTKIEKRALSQRVAAITREMVTDSLPAVSAEDEEPAAEASDPFVWTDAANERLQRAPEGFMRLAARRTVEDYAKENGIAEITLDVAEEGLAIAREQMGEAMRSGMTMQSPHPSKDQREENEPTDETGSFECQLCGYVVDGKRPAHCSACGVGDLKKLTEEERDIVSTTATITLEWDEKALARLERVPAGFMRTMTRCRIEQWARKFARDRVSLDVVEAKYASWAEGSQGLQMELDWSADAVQRIERIPDFIRPRVVREIEGHARAVGQSRVTGDVLDRVMSNWGGAQGGFHAAAG